jgi:hypothetical protein
MKDYIKSLEEANEKYQTIVSDQEKIIEAYNEVEFIFAPQYASKNHDVMKVKLMLSFKMIPESIHIATLSKDPKTKGIWWFKKNGAGDEAVGLLTTEPVQYYIDFMLKQLAISRLPYKIKVNE